MRLVNYFDKLEALMDEIAENDGVVNDVSLFDNINGSIKDKIDKTVSFLRELENREEFYKAEVSRINKKKKAVGNMISSIRDNLKYNMINSEHSKIKTSLYTVSVGYIDDYVYDDEKVDEEFKKYSYTIDKKALRELVKSGEEVDGITVEKKSTLRIR